MRPLLTKRDFPRQTTTFHSEKGDHLSELENHPAAEIFPLASEDQFSKLVADIREHGLIEPIALYQGRILDGRNRYQACLQLGVEPRFEKARLGEQTPIEYVLSKNLYRRHLTAPQRAALAIDLLPALSEEAAQRQRWLGKPSEEEHLGDTNDRGTAAQKAAELVGLGHSTIEKTIAIAKRDPRVIDRMRSGDIKSVDAARREAGMLPGSDSVISDELPQFYYGKGDRWREATQPLLRYLKAWERRGFEYRHVNHVEARRRLRVLDQITEMLSVAKADLEQRSVKATTSIGSREGKER